MVHGRASSARTVWLRDPAAAVAGTCGAAAAAVGMILSSLASFSLVLRVLASPVSDNLFDFFIGIGEEKEEKLKLFVFIKK